LSNDVQRIGVTMKSSMQLRALLRRVTTRAEGTGRKKDRPPMSHKKGAQHDQNG
jgi:hypothetical protein